MVTNPYQPVLIAEDSLAAIDHGSCPRWPTPIIILSLSVFIGITVAATMTTDLVPRAGELNLALWAFTGLSLTFGAAGALFGYQYLLGHVPLWYSSAAMGFFAVLPLSQYPDIDSMSFLISILATANGFVATLTPWISRRFFFAGVRQSQQIDAK